LRGEDRRYLLGCSGYFYRGWRGRFYPEELKPGDWLPYYSEFFNTVELNSTFYNFPKRENLRRLAKKTPEDFVFSVKVNRAVTHLKRFRGTKDLLDRFYLEVREGLGSKLGCVLFQLPPSYRFSEENLERILEQMNPDFLNVLEFRHGSWWREEVFRALRSEGVVFCSVSFPGLPEDLVETGDTLYVRFHGKKEKYRYRYSEEELREWARRIEGSRARTFYLYFNNDYNAYAPENCRTLMEILRVSPR
jgi:uncharacterized protein YecE (DUF72 family)